MKNNVIKVFLFITVVAVLFSACSNNKTEADENENLVKKKTIVKQIMSLSEFEEMLGTLPLAVSGTEYIALEKTEESVNPAYLRVVVKNNTDTDIKNITVAFVGWDENGAPVKIRGYQDSNRGEYVKKAEFIGVNLVSGGTYGENEGLLLDESCKIAGFKAIAFSFETFEGHKWENPYFNQFCGFYEGKQYPEDADVEIELMDSGFAPIEETINNNEDTFTEEELIKALESQNFTVAETEYVIQDEEKKALYPDILKISLNNKTETDIESAEIAFVAWDENNLPVRITGTTDLDGGDFLKLSEYTENAIKSGTKREWDGVYLTEKNNIAEFKAIVVSYKAVTGEVWENPYYEDFLEIYKEKKLHVTEEVEE